VYSGCPALIDGVVVVLRCCVSDIGVMDHKVEAPQRHQDATYKFKDYLVSWRDIADCLGRRGAYEVLSGWAPGVETKDRVRDEVPSDRPNPEALTRTRLPHLLSSPNFTFNLRQNVRLH
jgi:hypothetical protein